MKFKCSGCQYETNDKSNYNRHLKSKRHPNSSNVIIKDDKHNKSKYVCMSCNKSYSSRQSLHRHRQNVCTLLQNNVIITDQDKITLNDDDHNLKSLIEQCDNKIDNSYLQTQFNFLSEQINILAQMMQINVQQKIPNNTVSNTTNNTVNNNTTYNLSVKTYVQKKYPNAPGLQYLNDYSKLQYDNKNLMDILIENYDKNSLHKYLGDFIIKSYKKDNPAEQSMWSSDTSRLTYIISELLASKKSIWRHDYKGIKIKEYILIPLLNYIREYIDGYCSKIDIKKMKKLSLDEIEKITIYNNKIMEISLLIDSGILIDDILKYITPYFCLGKECDDLILKNNNLQIDYFVDK
ncbi:hypothetical protein Indivirus_1_12 [Indivirus ILV1]|uniref:C2H2-type domain-containing protein n=1 Tax=Indivirus ILV1 TaxID=1977633 RepID=A0A1V0SCF1_9VIRU|nr:hypothetical protein Indivirus_1_12 [Indivirus ILV1]